MKEEPQYCRNPCLKCHKRFAPGEGCLVCGVCDKCLKVLESRTESFIKQ